MGWVKLDDGFFRHPKAIAAGRDGRMLFIASICYSGAGLTDGFVPSGALTLLGAETGVTKPAAAAAMLVAVGLWEPVDGGYLIHDYLEYNTSSGKVHAEREAARERMQRRRSPDVRPNNSRSSPDVRQPETETEYIPPISPKGERRRKSSDLRGFAEFWLLYPRKVAKGAAETAWSKLAPDDRDGAIAAIERQRQWPCFTQAPPEKQPHPATWLNARRWEDEPPQTIGTRDLTDEEIARLPVNHHLRIARQGLRVV